MRRTSKLSDNTLKKEVLAQKEQPKADTAPKDEQNPRSFFSSRFDSILISGDHAMIASTSADFLISSRFEPIAGIKQTSIKREDQPKVPWPGEGSILINDKRKRNGVK